MISDIHTHVFDGGFIPVEGVMITCGVARGVAPPLPRLVKHHLQRELPAPELAAHQADEYEYRAYVREVVARVLLNTEISIL